MKEDINREICKLVGAEYKPVQKCNKCEARDDIMLCGINDGTCQDEIEITLDILVRAMWAINDLARGVRTLKQTATTIRLNEACTYYVVENCNVVRVGHFKYFHFIKGGQQQALSKAVEYVIQESKK